MIYRSRAVIGVIAEYKPQFLETVFVYSRVYPDGHPYSNIIIYSMHHE